MPDADLPARPPNNRLPLGWVWQESSDQKWYATDAVRQVFVWGALGCGDMPQEERTHLFYVVRHANGLRDTRAPGALAPWRLWPFPVAGDSPPLRELALAVLEAANPQRTAWRCPAFAALGKVVGFEVDRERITIAGVTVERDVSTGAVWVFGADDGLAAALDHNQACKLARWISREPVRS